MAGTTTVIFDFDGTIADTLPLIYEAFDAAFRPVLGRRLTDAEIRARFGPPDNHIIAALVPPEESEAAFARYVEVYEREHARLVRSYEGIPELVNAARDAGMNLGVVTGKSRQTAIYSLREIGLLEHFGAIYAGDDVTRQKPDPEAVIKILADLGHRDEHAGFFVGDSAADVLAGRAAGLRTVGVTWGSPDHDDLFRAGPDVVVDHPHQLLPLLGLPSAR